VPQLAQKLLNYLRSLRPKQIALLAAALLITLACVALFVRLIGRSDYKTLYSGLAPGDAQALATRLAAKNIAYEISPDGTAVLVPAEQLDKARLEMASEGLPQSGRMGFELFDKPNWAGSDFSEQVNYQRALEGELERTIQTMGAVQAVRVHLVLPHESLYSSRERVAKAAVVIKLRGGGLPDADVAAITNLVASSVDNLSPDNVTLIGADGRTPLVAQGKSHNPLMTAPLEQETALAEKIVATLAPIVGPEHVKASVTLDYDPGSGETTSEIYDPNAVALTASQVQEERIGGFIPAGIPGTASNLPSAQTTPATGPGSTPANTQANAAGNPPANPATATPAGAGTNAAAKPGTGATAGPANAAALAAVETSSETGGQRSESRTYAVSKTIRHVTEPGGKIRRVAAAVLVDDAAETAGEGGAQKQNRRKRTPEEMKQFEDLARAAIGFDASRGDQVVVQNLAFQAAPEEAPVKLPLPERIRDVAEKWMWALRFAALALLFAAIYFLVLRPMKDQLVAAFRQAPVVTAVAQRTPRALSGDQPLALPAGGSSAELEEELSQPSSDVQRVLKLKRHLADKMKKEPQAASQLIRGWMREPEGHR
jgi:flagellar M-ring protein FliF